MAGVMAQMCRVWILKDASILGPMHVLILCVVDIEILMKTEKNSLCNYDVKLLYDSKRERT